MLVPEVDDNLYYDQVADVGRGVRKTNGSRNTQTNVPFKSKPQHPVQVQGHKNTLPTREKPDVSLLRYENNILVDLPLFCVLSSLAYHSKLPPVLTTDFQAQEKFKV
jgi:hypothetical protein